MYSIIIRGNQQSGKSTTIREVCRLLKSKKVSIIDLWAKIIKPNGVLIDEIYNGTYILEYEGKIILVIAGAPTEQEKTVTQIIEICIELKISIDFIISAMRSKEMKLSFDTINEIKRISTLLQIFKIKKIEGDDYQESIEWKDRISNILKVVNDNL